MAKVVFFFVIAHGGHVRHVGGDRLDLAHKTVAQLALLFVHVVAKVANVINGVVETLLSLFLQSGKRLGVLGAQIAINCQAWRPI